MIFYFDRCNLTALKGLTTPKQPTAMAKKQIIIHADPETHAWLKQESSVNRRTIGMEALFKLLGCRPSDNSSSSPKTRKTKGAAK